MNSLPLYITIYGVYIMDVLNLGDFQVVIVYLFMFLVL